MTRSTNGSQIFDPINVRLLKEVESDARLSLAELARRTNLSAPAVGERLRRLERAGVITGYHAEVDPKALGYPLAAIVRIRPTTRQVHKISALAHETREVVECHRITGEDCFLLKLHLRSMDNLEAILDRFLALGETTTSFIQSSPVARRALLASEGELSDAGLAARVTVPPPTEAIDTR